MSLVQIIFTVWTMMIGGWLAHYNLEYWLSIERRNNG